MDTNTETHEDRRYRIEWLDGGGLDGTEPYEDPAEVTWGQLLAENPEERELLAEVDALAPGASVEAGGGAAPTVRITRLAGSAAIA